MFGHFCMFYWCIFLGHPVAYQGNVLTISDALSLILANHHGTTQWYLLKTEVLEYSKHLSSWSAESAGQTDNKI